MNITGLGSIGATSKKKVPYNYDNLKSKKVKPMNELDKYLLKITNSKDDFHNKRMEAYSLIQMYNNKYSR
tara:strand:+ start:276 stop:485 length:210 start_codon:yes stop_codon:yes gene_type:complete